MQMMEKGKQMNQVTTLCDFFHVCLYIIIFTGLPDKKKKKINKIVKSAPGIITFVK